jgi:hypothetical protein
MTAAVTIMQATDWSKYSFEEWCRQLGAWINGDNETMVMVVKTMPTKRITQQQRERLLAMYMSDETLRDRLCVRRKGTCCQLDCNEARAIQRLFLDIQLVEDVILQEWISSIWSHYFDQYLFVLQMKISSPFACGVKLKLLLKFNL